MQDFVFSGRAVDLVLIVIALEFVILTLLRKGQRSRAAADLFFMLAPGAALLLALRASLTGEDWQWIALPIAVSFPLHVIDVMRRLRSMPGQ